MTLPVDAPDPPALRRLVELDDRWASSADVAQVTSTGFTPMGYQPALDGLRAISVIAVIFYHAGFTWMPGGFFGVEVFFVVSGYLITSLLLDEREKDQRVSLEQFWLRRARRLLPALFTMLVAVALWATFFGSAEQQSTLRRDLPWSIFYLGNWGQIIGSTPYFSSADPPLLRHLWSLAVEEQWYLIWPLVFVGAMTLGAGRIRSRGTTFVGISVALMIITSALHGTISNNALYLNTFTRASGLLLGAGSAFLWRPWRSFTSSQQRGRRLDTVGAAALTLLVCIMCAAVLSEGYVYQWLLPIVSVLSMVVVAVVVYPAAHGMRAILGWKPLVELGRRSYGIYLWHFPVFVVGHVYHSGSWPKFVAAIVVTGLISEGCYRYVETPIRKGFLGRWLRDQRKAMGGDRVRRVRLTASSSFAAIVIVIALVAFYSSVGHFDAAKGGGDATFTLGSSSTVAGGAAAGSTAGSTAGPTTDSPSVTIDDSAGGTTGGTTDGSALIAPGTPATPTTASATETTAAVLPRRLVVVGDSQAHSLAINLPDGIGGTFTITDGSVEGCGVYDTGTVISARAGFNRSFGNCAGWATKWGDAASSSEAQVALVVIGAWDVFDLQLDDQTLTFGTPTADAYYLAHLQIGIDALKASGAHVALLEVPCMRPQDVKGAGVPALPERADDARTGHVNVLLKQAAAADPDHVTFVAGPTQWCNDPAISTDLGYRWDGVHVYKPGANLIYETIAGTLLSIPVTAT